MGENDILKKILNKLFSGQGNVTRINKASFKNYLKWLLIGYVIIGIVSFFKGELVLDISLSFGLIMIPLIGITFFYGVSKGSSKYIKSGILIGVIFIAVNVISSPLFRWKDYRNLIGEVENVEFTNEIKHMDLKELPTIDIELALKLADKKLGEIPSLGSQVKIGDMTLQSVNGSLYYVAPLEHSSFIKWFVNGEGTPGYIKVSATNQNDVELVTNLNGQDIKLKYLESSYLFSNLRVASYLKDLRSGHTDYTFELDDDGNPYWIITRYDTSIGVSGKKPKGALILDAQTGNATVYGIEDMPKWVDRIQPMEFIKGYIDNWGTLVHGIFNFSDKDKLKTTEGMNLIFNDGECYYYTGITSVGNDEGLVGFTLTNTRTGKTTMYKTSGATETAAMKSAEGKVQQFKYTATFPYLINIQNEPTYFTTLKDSNGLVKQYAMVNIKNYNTVAVGDSPQGALNRYIEALNNNNLSLEGSSKSEKINGEIEKIGLVIKDGRSIYDIKLKDNNKIFSVSTETSRDVALASKGDKVEIEYINVGDNKYIIANKFVVK